MVSYKGEDGWWLGHVHGKTGCFPSSHVEPIDDNATQNRLLKVVLPFSFFFPGAYVTFRFISFRFVFFFFFFFFFFEQKGYQNVADLPTKEDWKEILKGGQELTFNRGEVILHKDDLSQRIYQILRGSCDVVQSRTVATTEGTESSYSDYFVTFFNLTREDRFSSTLTSIS